MIGMPVIINGKGAGSVVKGVLTQDGRSLRGVIVRNGLWGSRWLPREKIHLIGQLSLLAEGKPEKVPKDANYRLFRVADSNGMRLGVVTDALIHEETMRVSALEISAGPLDDLMDGRWFATAYHVQPHGDMGHVTIAGWRKEVN